MIKSSIISPADYNECNKKYNFFNNYDKKIRWIAYYNQISETLSLKPNKILEVGIGSGLVSNYLKKYFNVQTCDINKKLNPNKLCDVKELSKKFEKNIFDVVLCSQVLEHLPFNEFDLCLKELNKVSKRYVILSLPHSAYHIRISFFMLKNFQININLSIPNFKKHKFYKGHFWEIGKIGFSKNRIRKSIKRHFSILKEYGMKEDPFYRFYVLEKLEKI